MKLYLINMYLLLLGIMTTGFIIVIIYLLARRNKMMQEIIDGSWDGKIRIGNIPFMLLILILLPFIWLFDKIENLLDIPIINLKRYEKVNQK